LAWKNECYLVTVVALLLLLLRVRVRVRAPEEAAEAIPPLEEALEEEVVVVEMIPLLEDVRVEEAEAEEAEKSQQP
jgi:hypothetical protein